MDWFLYDNGLLHERVKRQRPAFSSHKENFQIPLNYPAVPTIWFEKLSYNYPSPIW